MLWCIQHSNRKHIRTLEYRIPLRKRPLSRKKKFIINKCKIHRRYLPPIQYHNILEQRACILNSDYTDYAYYMHMGNIGRVRVIIIIIFYTQTFYNLRI